MKSLVICPMDRQIVTALSECCPLGNFPVYGKTILAHWLERLAAKGATHVRVLTPGKTDDISASIGTGDRWGLAIQVTAEPSELSIEASQNKYRAQGDGEWLPSPYDFIFADRLPGMTETMLQSYGQFFTSVVSWISHATANGRVGLRQAAPGVWIGLGARIGRKVVLRPPVWIGENVRIGKEAIIGPNAIIEDRSFIDRGAEVYDSFVGADTYIGAATHVAQSLALGRALVNYRTNSVAKISDPFLMDDLRPAVTERPVARTPETYAPPPRPSTSAMPEPVKVR